MRKIICLIMTMLLFCATCVPVMAETQEIEGSGITCELTDNDTTLTISGTGDMPDFNNPLLRPWHSDVKSITTVIINPGVTSIGKQAFASCTNLQSVTIPSSVTRIGEKAFLGCAKQANFTFKSIVPPVCDGTVQLPPSTAVYVPHGAIDAYKENITWNDAIKNSISEAYMVDILPAQHGTIIVNKDFFIASEYKEASETVTIDAIPDEGYQLKSLVLRDAETTTDITEDMSFTMPCDNVTLTAEFELIENEVGSFISEGNLWIIITVSIVAIGCAAFFIIKKKKAA